jgi:hypothetical protein
MSQKPRLAVITTVYRPFSHCDVIVSRWLDPRASDAAFGWPAMGGTEPATEIASFYIDQFPDNDIGRETGARHKIPVFESVREALALGGQELAVDGVLLIAEHGDYPYNRFFQKQYPRAKLFNEITEVFRDSGRSVPVFNDKHLSYDSLAARNMVAVADELGFPLMAGSSLPCAGFAAPWLMPSGTALDEGIGLFYCGPESYGHHSIEFLQSAVARRSGGESGICSITAYCGDSFWEAAEKGQWSDDLMKAALSQTITAQPGNYRDNLREYGPAVDVPRPWPVAFCFEHADGLKTSHIMLHGHIEEFAIAVKERSGQKYSGRDVTSVNTQNSFFGHFAALNSQIEKFMLSGEPPFPIEHHLLCTLALSTSVRAMTTPGQTVETPELVMPYVLS